MIFTKTEIGYLHTKSNKPCQDFSSCYKDKERIILTCSDGHGGELYIRSDIGSRFASDALIRTFLRIERSMLTAGRINATCENIRLNVLCEWNTLVEEHLKKNPIRKSETNEIGEDFLKKIRKNPVRAYGTTLCGVLIFAGKIICVQIGDGSSFLLKKEKPVPVFEEDDEQVGNLTYSMCEDNAYAHIRTAVFRVKDYDGVLLCTDGVVNPYGSYENFEDCFVKNILQNLKRKSEVSVEELIKKLGKESGFGDDVSVCVWLKDRLANGSRCSSKAKKI